MEAVLGSSVANGRGNNWRQLAEQAATEQDPHKLLILVRKLNAALDEHLDEIRGKPLSTQKPVARRMLFVDEESSIRITLPPSFKQRGFEVRVAATVSVNSIRSPG